MTAYGFCPKCGAPGVSRERRPNGNDICRTGHEYPSREADHPPVKPVRQKDYDYRVRHTTQGGYVHCRVFSKPRGQATWANCGTIVMRAEEMASFEIAFLAAEFMGG